jgi:hypothetical protein
MGDSGEAVTPRFRRTPSGVEPNLEPSEYAILERIPGLVESIGANRHDPAATRLDPPVHPGDDRASVEFSRLAGTEVAQGRSADAETFQRTLQSAQADGSLSVEDAEAWVRTLGTARVALIARKGREFDDGSFAAADRGDPDILLVDYLGILQEDLLVVLLAGLPATGDSR